MRQLRRLTWPVWLSVISVLMFTAVPATGYDSSRRQRPCNENPPPFDFSDSFYVTNEQGEKVRHHNIWDTRGRAYDNYIAPGRSESVRYQFTIPKEARGPLRVTARVLYRKFNRFFSDWVLGKSANYPIVEMTSRSITLSLGENRPAITKLDQTDLVRFNNLGIALVDQLMYSDARRAFETTTSIDGAYADGYINQALASSWTDFAEMHRLLDKALSISPDNARALYYKGALLRMAGKAAAALELFTRIEPKYPRDRLILNQMGLCYRALREHAEARQSFERVLAIDPDDITALYFITEAYRKTGLNELADQANVIYLDKFEDWRIHYWANDYIKRDEAARSEAAPWHVHSNVDLSAAKHADPIYWTSEGAPKKRH